jgi:hypothetical protein
VNPDPAEAVRRRDEILQVMFWLRGEGLAEAAGVAELGRFLDPSSATELASDLRRMMEAGLVEGVGNDSYRLTTRGREEGGRRFSDEFSDYVHHGHGACSDPDCDCHALGPEACVHDHPGPAEPAA